MTYSIMGYEKIALGGSCHWCTEAVFLSLKGVQLVQQGFVASSGEQALFSEAVIVQYDPITIRLDDLINIHLHTHRSTSDHSMRKVYRSAVYTFNEEDARRSVKILKNLQKDFEKELITRVYPYKAFKPSAEMFHNYYYSNPEKPFCKSYIEPKLKVLLAKFSEQVDIDKLKV